MFVAQHVCPLLLWCALLAGELASAFGGVRRGFSTTAAEDFSEVQVRCNKRDYSPKLIILGV